MSNARSSKWTLRRSNSPFETVSYFPAASRRHFLEYPGKSVEWHQKCLTFTSWQKLTPFDISVSVFSFVIHWWWPTYWISDICTWLNYTVTFAKWLNYFYSSYHQTKWPHSSRNCLWVTRYALAGMRRIK